MGSRIGLHHPCRRSHHLWDMVCLSLPNLKYVQDSLKVSIKPKRIKNNRKNERITDKHQTEFAFSFAFALCRKFLWKVWTEFLTFYFLCQFNYLTLKGPFTLDDNDALLSIFFVVRNEKKKWVAWLPIEFFMLGVSVRLSDRSLHRDEQKKFCQKLSPVGLEIRTSGSSGQCLTNWARQESVGQ